MARLHDVGVMIHPLLKVGKIFSPGGLSPSEYENSMSSAFLSFLHTSTSRVTGSHSFLISVL